jgi:hypothetical protein
MLCVRWKAAKDNIILVAKLHQLERLVCAKSIVNQDSRLLACSSFCQWVENMLNPVETYCCIGIATIRVAKMPSWGRVSCPSAPMCSSRPNNQRVEIPTVCRDRLYRCNQSMFHACSPVSLQLILTHEDLEQVEDAQKDTCLIYIVCVLCEDC